MDTGIEEQQCAQCGAVIGGGTSDGDFCADCASKIRYELTPGSQIRKLWIRVSPGLQRLPLLTLFLIVINVAVYSFVVLDPGPGWGRIVKTALELNSASAIRGEWWRFISYAFVQTTLLHLLSNMVLLWALGWLAEPRLGTASLISLWIASAAAGSIAEVLVRGPSVVALGSSGVVFGLAGALLSIYVFRRGPLTSRFRYWRIASLSALVLVGFLGEWFVLWKINAAHVGGFVAGTVLGLTIPLRTSTALKRTLAFVVTLIVLAGSAMIAGSRQETWLELKEVEMQRALGNIGDPSSIPKLESILAKRPDVLRAHFLFAEALQANNRNDEAIREYRYVLDKWPTLSEVWYRMGFAFTGSQRYESAADAFAHALQLIPNDPTIIDDQDRRRRVVEVRRALAAAYESSGKLEDAITQYKEILQETPPVDLDHRWADHELKRLETLKAAQIKNPKASSRRY